MCHGYTEQKKCTDSCDGRDGDFGGDVLHLGNAVVFSTVYAKLYQAACFRLSGSVWCFRSWAG